VRQSLDGAIWILTDDYNGRIIRLVPAKVGPLPRAAACFDVNGDEGQSEARMPSSAAIPSRPRAADAVVAHAMWRCSGFRSGAVCAHQRFTTDSSDSRVEITIPMDPLYLTALVGGGEKILALRSIG
jgi:hypothetical protein